MKRSSSGVGVPSGPGALVVDALAAVAVACGIFAAPPLTTPGSDVVVPSSCSVAVSHLPPSRMVATPSGGKAFLLFSDAGVQVLLNATYGTTPFHAVVSIVDPAGHTVQSMTFPNDVVAVGASGNLLLIYNDKLGYWFSLPSGAPVNERVWIDQYRGRFTNGNRTEVDTSVAYSALGGNGLSINHHVQFAVVAQGCWFPG